MTASQTVFEALRVNKAKYDAAATTAENCKHWQQANVLSTNAANSPKVRRLLRSRCRYEVANNCYAMGLVLILANDVIGTGPRLQMLSPQAELNRTIEQEFGRWSRAVRLAEKLRTMRCSRASDGEAFAILTINPVRIQMIQLDLRLVEADQVTTPDVFTLEPNQVDGIVFDTDGNPVEYHVLQE